jgi:ring-1,2-phenylacetyl-CoA epoxidase subunit PaaE
MSTQFHSLKVSNLQRETEGCVSVAFEVPTTLQGAFSYASGQYLTLKTIIDGEELRRSYSLCSAPHENQWRVAIKEIPNGKFSSFANQELQVGDTLEVMAPMGNFKFEPNANSQRHYVLFAAGSGVTPVFSILKTILLEEPLSTVTLFYGNKGLAEVIFREELEAIKNRFLDRLNLVHVFSRENMGVPLLKGRIDAQRTKDLLAAFLKNQTIDAAYICGPQDMILAVKDELSAFGLSAQQIHFELFHAAPIEKKADASQPEQAAFESKIELIMDGEVTNFYLSSDGPTILDAAYKAGADAPFACKGGVCCTCKAKVLRGEVSMDVNYALTPEEVEQGYVLTCQAHPKSNDILISFDD